jgi:AraC family transcriptional activator of pobA
MRRSKRKVPVFELYGERSPGGFAQRLHIEDIQSRSHRYRWEIAAHTHRGLQQCVFVLHGPAEVQTDGERSALKAPAIVLLPPASVHAFRFSADTRGFVLTVAPEALVSGDAAEYLADFDAVLDTPHLLTLDPEGNLPRRLQQLFERLAEEFRQPDSLAAPLCLWLARSALWLIAQEVARHQQAPPGSPRQHRWLSQFRALVESHYAEHWPVARYARALGLTEGRLQRLVRAQSGQSVLEQVQSRLMLEARRRLTYVAMPVAQIAHELGFDDPAYFCRFFRRHAGVSPRAFRTSHG